jgi:PKD repeat protein
MRSFLLFVLAAVIFVSCKKEASPIAKADFNFRADTGSTVKLATYDTCTLFNNSINADSVSWSLGDGRHSSDAQLVLSYPKSGTYNVMLTAYNKDGSKSSITKNVTVLDRVLKKIIIDYIYWDTIPNSIPFFNAKWPTSPTADVFVRIQKYNGDTTTLPIGIYPNVPVVYTSNIIKNVSYHTGTPIEIPVAGKVIIDKPSVTYSYTPNAYLTSLMAKDAKGNLYCIISNFGGGSSMGIDKEDINANSFIVHCSLGGFGSFKLVCDFE